MLTKGADSGEEEQAGTGFNVPVVARPKRGRDDTDGAEAQTNSKRSKRDRASTAESNFISLAIENKMRDVICPNCSTSDFMRKNGVQGTRKGPSYAKGVASRSLDNQSSSCFRIV